MSKLLKAGLLAILVLCLSHSSSPAVDRKAVNKAIDSGVKALGAMQTEDGTWSYNETGFTAGATALAGLTLLECGAKTDDKAVLRAAAAVRKASIPLVHTYSIALAILFFDRLGDPDDVPLIESLSVRLLAGQTATGGWSYRCPPISEAEARRLRGVLANRRELAGPREARGPEAGQRTVRDLPREIQQQLAQLDRMGGFVRQMGSDNSNTQFATLALWVARRYGLPVNDALERVETRFRTSQHTDGGWGYFERGRMAGPLAGSTASMTCAGLLGLAISDGKFSESVRQRKPGSKYVRDINKDRNLLKGLAALNTVIGEPPEDAGLRGGDKRIPSLRGRTYYFLWSLERVAVALDLKTIGKKDWYAWGAELLLANQQADGSWRGNYAECGADTCFALLFLKRANLAPDLTAGLTGRVQDPGERVLRGGGGTKELEKVTRLRPGIESKNAPANTDGRYPEGIARSTEAKPPDKPSPPPASPTPPASRPDSETPPPPTRSRSVAARMAGDLAKSTGGRHATLLRLYRDTKGTQYTDALALAIPQLTGDRKRKVREALVQRLTHVEDAALSEALKEQDVEVRRAAALACAAKKSKALVPELIPLVRDSRPLVSEAVHEALKQLTGQDFGPKANADREERVQSARKWLEWWKKHEDKPAPRP